ncbi:hypothetical protein SERLA73DRAFT_178861 [Serpula lacrymans var. lacrymans S7.3]|uniref:Uncharacterized protein n=2 Tax=Serpula lacrymans var. lacrymans TaxID=341189 RepID=F8PT55_SERL3|nr:uncharacterized protein SERLADRAFT_463638 [Serpula lacrymans var. lacrymans S7.9]EGO00885.1 hypothetical protein SERLA73DRAFT_178861 [Serpula lacrymans var. lacrymans S7.3]EGO26502.1 hypothetical protein SERLADRAFT_463638 [Serpula lacrymans var. lacrymans S7.9]
MLVSLQYVLWTSSTQRLPLEVMQSVLQVAVMPEYLCVTFQNPKQRLNTVHMPVERAQVQVDYLGILHDRLRNVTADDAPTGRATLRLYVWGRPRDCRKERTESTRIGKHCNTLPVDRSDE